MSAATAPADTAPQVRRWGVSAVVAGLVALVVALILGGGAAPAVLGVSDPGAVTRWGLPIAKFVLNASAAVTLGLLGLTVVLPVRNGGLGDDANRALHAVSWTALVLAAAAAVVHVLTLSDLVGRPLGQALAGNRVASYTSSIPQGRVYAAVVLLALVIVSGSRLTRSRRRAIALFGLGVATLVPMGLIGHSSTGDYHQSARVSLLAHLIAVALWVGGLVAISWYAGWRGRELPLVASVFSSLALGCFVVVAGSGLLNAWVRVNSLTEVFTSAYGLIILAKVTAFITLGCFGYSHRRRTLLLLEAGRPGAFRRLAAGESAVMAVAMGLAVALSRTEPPSEASHDMSTMTAVRSVLDFPVPPEISAGRLLTETYPDALFALGCLAAVLLYMAGLWRLRQQGKSWPVGRTIAWLAGVVAVAIVSLSGVMTYSMTMLSVHVAQQMTLLITAPVLLVLGAPITLALGAIGPAPQAQSGPREMIVTAISSPLARVLTYPLVVFALFASSLFIVYFTGLFETILREHTWHILVSTYFLLVGYLFFESLIGTAPLPKRPHHPARIGIQLMAVGSLVIFGLALTESTRRIAEDFYLLLSSEITWLPDTQHDQTVAAQLAWGFGTFPALIVIAVILTQWSRQRRRSRQTARPIE